VEVSEDGLIVRTLQHREVLGRDPQIRGFPATCDAGYLFPKMPTAVFGPGSLSQARPDEYVSIKDVLDAALVYAGTAIKLLE
jgi:acetylornithine deacetylase/succinyl-diaminopimelate desuccinylase-like protein